ncbi:hypothetical protein ZEAMMB73_Zm00001d024892 [Zea mays]|uniref:Uncharacterized protein n=1 Tax=Zea mays TaxID=4577 RepID=A0A1D6J2J4_MAIZE|nr:hypothetical protein ZEAMMB73_Zm00001d024892 [Zea mays]
MGCLGLNCVA